MPAASPDRTPPASLDLTPIASPGRAPPRSLVVASLNGRTLKAAWRLHETIRLMKDLKIDVLCLSETRRVKGYDACEDDFVLKCFPADEAGVGGLGFLFAPRAWSLLLSLELDARVCVARLQASDRRLVLVSAYAPTAPNTVQDPAQTHGFYARLSSICNATPRRDRLVLAGDFNAPLDYDGTLVTTRVPGDENDNSAIFRAFVDGNGLTLANGDVEEPTFFGPNDRITRLDWIACRER